MNGDTDNGHADPRLESTWASLPGGEPPADVDRRILSEARAMAAHRRRHASVGRWAGSLALAASVVIGISLTWRWMVRDVPTRPEADSIPLMIRETPPTPAESGPDDDRERTKPSDEIRAPSRSGAQAPAPDRGLTNDRGDGAAGAFPERMARTEPESELLEIKLPPPPKTWLDDIRALREAGREEEADRSLLLFRKVYPDYPLQPETEAPSEPGDR